MLGFIRTDLANFTAYTPHPGGEAGEPSQSAIPLDRLDTNESPFDLPMELKEKLAWTYQQEIEANRYPDGGHQNLKVAIAEYVNESVTVNPPITPAHLSVGNGSDELIRSILIATCLRGEGSILVANPTFSMYEILAQTLGIPVVTVSRSQDNFELNLVEAKAAIAHIHKPPIRVVFVVHPNSPTGNALTPAELDWLRSLSEEILVVIDEAYFEFSQTSVLGELSQHPNWIILRTFSKAFRLAAYRVGYCIAHPDLITILEKVRLPYNLPSFSQGAALVALTHRQLLLPSIAETITERERLRTALAQHSILQVWPSVANFIYVRDRQLVTNSTSHLLTEWVQQLKTQGTLIRQTGGGLRITVGTIDENTRTIQRFESLMSPFSD